MARSAAGHWIFGGGSSAAFGISAAAASWGNHRFHRCASIRRAAAVNRIRVLFIGHMLCSQKHKTLEKMFSITSNMTSMLLMIECLLRMFKTFYLQKIRFIIYYFRSERPEVSDVSNI